MKLTAEEITTKTAIFMDVIETEVVLVNIKITPLATVYMPTITP